jgi:hypothetical protein
MFEKKPLARRQAPFNVLRQMTIAIKDGAGPAKTAA